MKKQVKAYLDDPGGFNQGLQMYIQLGGIEHLSRLKQISQKAFVSAADKDLLLSALRKIYARMPDVEEAPGVDAAVAKSAVSLRVEPPSVTNLRAEGKKWKKRESFLHATLVNEATKGAEEQKLFELAQEMMEQVQPELQRIYGQIKKWEKTGELPADEVQKIQIQAVEQYKKMVNMQTRIYRLNARLKQDLPKGEKEKIEAEIAEKEKDIATIKSELNL